MVILSAIGLVDIILIVLAAALVIFTIAFNIWRKKKGKNCCGCSGCPSAGKCGKSTCDTDKNHD